MLWDVKKMFVFRLWCILNKNNVENYICDSKQASLPLNEEKRDPDTCFKIAVTQKSEQLLTK